MNRDQRKSKFVPKDSIGAFAVQCDQCLKWRLIPTKEEYETIRETFIENPFHCENRPGGSCDDPGDVEYDTSRLWVIDRPNIPKPPPSTMRMLVMRRDFSKLDTHYIMPNGKKVRSTNEVERFIEANPEHKGKLSVSSFSFTPPKVLEEMVPRNLEVKTPKSKKLKAAQEDD